MSNLTRIGQFLLERRKALGVRTTDIHASSGISIGNIRRIEDSLRGQNVSEPSLTTLTRYSNTLGVELMMKPHVTRILAVYNRGGGQGKTTTVVNLAYVMSKAGYKVLVIDGDPQASATEILGFRKKDIPAHKTIFETLNENTKLPDPLTTEFGFDLIPASEKLANAERIANVRAIYALKTHLATKTNYDYVLIDTPPLQSGVLISALMVAAEAVILATEMNDKGSKAFEDVFELISDCSHVNKNLHVKLIVPTRYEKNSATQRNELNDLIQNCGEEFVVSTPIRMTKLQDSSSRAKRVLLQYLENPPHHVNTEVVDGIFGDYTSLMELTTTHYPVQPEVHNVVQ